MFAFEFMLKQQEYLGSESQIYGETILEKIIFTYLFLRSFSYCFVWFLFNLIQRK